jgi:hypothetical protein
MSFIAVDIIIYLNGWAPIYSQNTQKGHSVMRRQKCFTKGATPSATPYQNPTTFKHFTNQSILNSRSLPR